MSINQEQVLILDYGSQYTQLIARRCREEGVLSYIERWDIPLAEIKKLKPIGEDACYFLLLNPLYHIMILITDCIQHLSRKVGHFRWLKIRPTGAWICSNMSLLIIPIDFSCRKIDRKVN